MRTRVDALYNATISIIKRDVQHIRLMAQGGKLPPPAALNLVAYAKLLKELRTEEVRLKEARLKSTGKKLEELSDSELEKLTKESLTAIGQP